MEESLKQKMQNLKLILAFDINKTLIIDDKSGGKNEKDCLNTIISEVTWGFFDKEK